MYNCWIMLFGVYGWCGERGSGLFSCGFIVLCRVCCGLAYDRETFTCRFNCHYSINMKYIVTCVCLLHCDRFKMLLL